MGSEYEREGWAPDEPTARDCAELVAERLAGRDVRVELAALREASSALLFELAQMRSTEVRVQVHEAAGSLRALLHRSRPPTSGGASHDRRRVPTGGAER